MKAVLILLLVVLTACFHTGAQSRRVTPAGSGKSNARAPRPTPTPVPENIEPLEVETEIVKVDTKLVTVPVRVLDRKGRFIGGLTMENFKVFEDGVEHEIAYFSGEQEPFTVALILDMSYSTKFQITDIQSAALSFIDQLGPRDQVMVVAFDQEVRMLCEVTTDRNRINRAIISTKIGTGTSLYEALDLVMNARLNKMTGRKAIILFTDGVDTTSTRSNDLQNLDDAMELDAIIYPIRYDTFQDVQMMKDKPVVMGPPIGTTGPVPTKGPPGNPFPIPIPTAGTPGGPGTTAEEYRRAEEYLDQLALRTGGQLYLANTLGNLSSAFSRIASELREYYSLGFYPPEGAPTGKIRKLKVRVDRPNVAVKARESYVVGSKSTRKSIR